MIEKNPLEKNSLPHSLGLILAFGVTSPLLKIGSLPPVTPCHLLGVPPPSPFGLTSFMDGPYSNSLKSKFFEKLNLHNFYQL